MQAYYLERALTMRDERQAAIRPGVANAQAPTMAEVFLAGQMEISLLQKALAGEDSLRVLRAESLAAIPGVPRRLGVCAYADPLAAPADCLYAQLDELRKASPQRRLFRILLVAGFGGNLGDNLLGMTAFRHLHAVLEAHLPAVSVDVLLGWHADDRLERLYRDAPGIDRILTQGIPLTEFSRYQACYDASNLITLPHYGQRPMVDWYLWWMGLDPQRIAPADKRNAVAVPKDDQAAVKADLAAVPQPRILFNPKSSVSLRTLPDERLPGLLQELLNAWPEASIILLQPPPFADPRVLDLSATITHVDRLAALVAEVDGLIGVDTYTAHLADALATPAVTIYTSFSPAVYPYYPLARDIVLPGAENLPGWGRPKLSDTDWQATATAYAAAWQQLSGSRLVAALHDAMTTRVTQSPTATPTILPPRRRHALPLTTRYTPLNNRIDQPARQRPDPLADLADHHLRDIARQALHLGDTVIHIAPGPGALTIDLARQVGPQGRLVAIEPRRQLFQLLLANLKQNDIWHADTHHLMPEGATPTWRPIHALDCTDDHNPLAMHNDAPAEDTLCAALDTLPLRACSLLILTPPLTSPNILAGARQTITRYRPIILIGPIFPPDAQTYATHLAPGNYQLHTLTLKPHPHCILIANPK